jgi:hypothetical protein
MAPPRLFEPEKARAWFPKKLLSSTIIVALENMAPPCGTIAVDAFEKTWQ